MAKAKKMTMKNYELSASDMRAEKSGAHGKEGSKKDMSGDTKGLAKMTAKGKK